MNQQSEAALRPFRRLVEIMDRLRGPGGCAWDRAQNFASIAPYTLEEAHEVADAIAQNDMPGLCEELGDLLLQVIFHARMAAEAQHFTLTDVINGIATKMERRHPHIFGAATVDGTAAIRAQWEDIKAAEKPRESALDGVALALPALTRAAKLSARAARKGFDWPDASGPRAKIDEELAELAGAQTATQKQEEAGDLLFAVANYLRHLDIDPEDALRHANRKFERRFRAIEKTPDFAQLDAGRKDALWNQVKSTEDGL